MKLAIWAGDLPNPVTAAQVEAWEERVGLRKKNGEKFKKSATEMLHDHTYNGRKTLCRNARFLIRERGPDGEWRWWFPMPN